MLVIKTYTPEQLIRFCRDSIIADDVGITSFNDGDVLYSKLKALCILHSQTSFDFAQAVRMAIRFGAAIGLGFPRKGATPAIGRIRAYRKPEFEIQYSGTATSVALSRTATHFTLVTASPSVPADDINLDFATYPNVQDIVDEINSSYPNWAATIVNSGLVLGTALFSYASQEVLGTKNSRNEDKWDVMGAAAAAIPVNSGFQVLVDDIQVVTTANSTLAAGYSATPEIASQTVEAKSLRFPALTLDTENSRGTIQTPISGVEFAVNFAAFAPGTDEESDVDYLSRFQIHVNGLAKHNRIGIESAILAIQGIKSVTVIPKKPTPGFNTIVADDGSGQLTAAQIAEIGKVLNGDPDDIDNYPGVGAAGIDFVIVTPIVVPVTVTVQLEKLSLATDIDAIQFAAQTAIEEYINTRKLGEAVIVSEIKTRVKNSHGEIYDVEVFAPSPDLCDAFRRLLIAQDSIARCGGSISTVTVTTL